MIIDHINLNHLRIFECVYRTRSMTAASQELHLTQSGVSQHIKTFEEGVGVRLFDRIKQRVVPTTQADLLFEQCTKSLRDLEQVFAEVRGTQKQLAGRVTIGMPIEFGNNVVLPLLAKFAKKHSLVKFNFKLDFASVMNEMLLDGKIDFAFVDDFTMDRKIAITPVYDEVLELCISPDLLKKAGTDKNSKQFFESLDYVEYQKDEAILRKWFDHHVGGKNLRLNVKATIMDVQGLAQLILTGTGAGVLPRHLVLKLQKDGHKIHIFKGSGDPLKNSISIAHHRERSQSPAAQTALSWLTESFAGPA
ncbi:MAG: LysR family transcriptional regulator [Methylotenera sp.]|nr:LysR family transcriptional regulator [Oligoflexia bacterium]